MTASANRSVAPFAAAAALLWLVGTGLCAAFGPAAVRGSLVAGALAAGAGAAISLAAIAFGIKAGTQGLVAGFAAGFFARGIAVAVGLIASGAQGRAALAYVASFFGFYALTQTIEILFVWSNSRAAQRSTT